MARSRLVRVRGLQPGYISVVAEAAMQAVRAKIEAARNPLLTYDYAEAIDSLLSVMPPEVKRILAKHEIDVDNVVSSALGKCERDEFAHPYVNEVRCLREVKRDLDKLLRLVFDAAHRVGLFVVEKEVVRSSERQA